MRARAEGIDRALDRPVIGVPAQVYESAEFRKFMDERGFEMLWGDAPQFAAFMKKDNAEIGDMLKLMGLAK